jgi:hypothetical protein
MSIALSLVRGEKYIWREDSCRLVQEASASGGSCDNGGRQFHTFSL